MAGAPRLTSKRNMLAKRAVSAVVLLIVSFALVLIGGWVFTIGVALILAIASWEFCRMFIQGGYHPSVPLLIISNFLLAIAASFQEIELLLGLLAILSLLTITYHVLSFPKHVNTSAIDLAASLAGLTFIGLFGSYLVRLRFLPDGLYWLILVVVPAGISDIGAYFFGSLFGRRKLASALSPNKTIEGYLGGLLTSMITGYTAGAISGMYSASFSGSQGLLIGFIIGIFCPLGDLGKSVFKRQFNLKHTSNLIPGHGGVLDRVDTWLWAGVIGYYLVTVFYM